MSLFHKRSGEDEAKTRPPMPMVYIRDEYVYKQISRDLKKEAAPSEDELNELGKDGWEMVGLYTYQDQLTIYFKRYK